MLSLFMAVAQTFVDSGFGSALIQRKEITDDDRLSVLFFSICAGVVTALLLCVGAPWIARFFHEDILVRLTRFLSLNLIINAFSTVQTASLARELDFRTPWKIGLVATGISGGVAVWMAWNGWGVWSLAVQSVLASLVSTCLLWAYRPWRPRGRFDRARLSSLFSFGSKLLASGLLNTLFERVHLMVIGKAFSPAALGLYTRAYSVQQFPANMLATIVTKVTFPVFASISEDRARLVTGVRKVLVSVMMLTMPMMLSLAALAKPLVLVLFGERWLPCVPYLSILALTGLFWPLHVINLSALMALGRSDLFLRAEIIKKVLVVVGLVATFKVSVLAVAWAALAVGVASYFVNAYYAGELTGYGAWRQAVDLAPYAAISFCSGGLALAVGASLSAFPALAVGAGTGIASATYLTSCHLLGLAAFKDTVRALLSGYTVMPANSEFR